MPPESALAALNAELREERLRAAAGRRAQTADPLAKPPPVLGKPELELEAGVVSRPPLGRVWVSGMLHAAVLGLVLLVPLLRQDSLPPLATPTRVFFAEPAVVAPPPPPPAAPPPAAAPRASKPAEPKPAQSFTAPVDVPERVRPEEAVDVGQPQGQPGGVEGGVPGGLVGAVIEKLPEAPSPPPRRPERVGISVKEPQKLKHVDPVYPDIAQRANVQGVVILECVISPAGRVAELKILRGVPLLDQAALDAVKQWTYKPTLLDGVPVSVVMPVTVQFQLTEGRPRRRD